MKLLFPLVLFINIVYSVVQKQTDESNQVPFYLKGPPKVTQKLSLTLEFEIVVTKDINTSDFKYTKSPALQFTLLAPAILKYNSEVTPLTLVPEKPAPTLVSAAPAIVKDETVNKIPFMMRSGKTPDDKLFTKCKIPDIIKIIDKMDDKFKANVGYYTKESLKDKLSALKPKGTLAIDIKSVTYNTKLKKGTYKWSGQFSRRDDIKTETDITEYYDEFVLALSVGEKNALDVQNEGHCITHHEISSAIMFKHFETTKKRFIGCRALDLDYSDTNYFRKFISGLTSSGIYKYDSIKHQHSITYSFQSNDREKLSFIGGRYVHLNFKIPKEFSGYYKLGDLCSSRFSPSLMVAKCDYDIKTNSINFMVLKSQVQLKTKYTITFNISDVPNQFVIIPGKLDGDISVIEEKRDSVTENDRTLRAKIKKVADNINSECTKTILELYKQSNNELRNKKYLVGYDSIKASTSDFLNIIYEVQNLGTNFYMYLLIQQDDKLFTKTSKIEIEPTEVSDYQFQEPDEFDPISFRYIRRNPGVKIENKKITIKMDATKGSKSSSRDNFYTLGFEFKTDDGIFERFLDPHTLKFTLKYFDDNTLKTAIPVLLSRNNMKIYNQFNKDLIIYGPNYDYKQKKLTVNLVLATRNHNKITALLMFDEENISSIEGKVLSEVVKNEITFDKTNLIAFNIEFEDKNERYTELEISLNVDIKKLPRIETELLVHGVTDDFKKIDLSDKKLNLMHERFELLEYEHFGYKECITKDTRFSSSRFRSGDNANYLFTKLVNCRRPWIPINIDHENTNLQLDVESKYKFNPTVSIVETLSASNYTKNNIKKLMEKRRFYEHTLYLLFDETGVKTIKNQMIAGEKCIKSDATCPDTDPIPILKSLINSLSYDNIFSLSNIVVGYYNQKKLDLYLARDFSKKTDFKKHTTINDIEHSQNALEKILNLAFANSSPDIMGSSFSVVVTYDVKNVEYLTRYLDEYKPHELYNDGVVPHPILVDVIPVDSESTVEVQSFNCNDTIKLKENDLINIDSVDQTKEIYPAEKIYHDLSYTNSFFNQPDIEKLGETTSLKGKEIEEKKSIHNKKDYNVFVNIEKKVEKECMARPLRDQTIQIVKLIDNAVKKVTSTAKSYNVIASCTSFGSEKNAKRPQTYTLSYRDIKLGEYEILAKEDSTEKLYGECDLDSLYKYMPDTPHFVEVKKTRVPTLPDQIRSNEVKNGIQIIKYGIKKEEIKPKKEKGDYSKPLIEIELDDKVVKK